MRQVPGLFQKRPADGQHRFPGVTVGNHGAVCAVGDLIRFPVAAMGSGKNKRQVPRQILNILIAAEQGVAGGMAPGRALLS